MFSATLTASENQLLPFKIRFVSDDNDIFFGNCFHDGHVWFLVDLLLFLSSSCLVDQ